MGNVGHTQNLEAFVRAFENDRGLQEIGARLVIAGDGVASDAVRAAIATDRVRLTGILDSSRLAQLLDTAAVGLVSQMYNGADFNVPSKLMNFMGSGLPVVAAVRADSEVARIIRATDAGWVADNPETCARTLAGALLDREGRLRRGRCAAAFAQREFAPSSIAERFEEVVSEVLRPSQAQQDVSAPAENGQRAPVLEAGAAILTRASRWSRSRSATSRSAPEAAI
jgi:glycosyltransferase involved in cell wall biosynthesis